MKIKAMKKSYQDDVPSNFENIEDEDQFYRVLAEDVEKQSDASLYATTPENPHELLPDDEIVGEAAIHNMHSKFK